jgi:hypothetical protein
MSNTATATKTITIIRGSRVHTFENGTVTPWADSFMAADIKGASDTTVVVSDGRRFLVADLAEVK